MIRGLTKFETHLTKVSLTMPSEVKMKDEGPIQAVIPVVQVLGKVYRPK